MSSQNKELKKKVTKCIKSLFTSDPEQSFTREQVCNYVQERTGVADRTNCVYPKIASMIELNILTKENGKLRATCNLVPPELEELPMDIVLQSMQIDNGTDQLEQELEGIRKRIAERQNLIQSKSQIQSAEQTHTSQRDMATFIQKSAESENTRVQCSVGRKRFANEQSDYEEELPIKRSRFFLVQNI